MVRADVDLVADIGEVLLEEDAIQARVAELAAQISADYSGRQLTLLVRTDGPVVDPTWSVDEIGLEDLLLAYMTPEELPTPPRQQPWRLRWHG